MSHRRPWCIAPAYCHVECFAASSDAGRASSVHTPLHSLQGSMDIWRGSVMLFRMTMAKANAKPQTGLVRDRVTPVRQYAGALWENFERVRALSSYEWKISNHCSAALPRHYGGPACIVSAGRAGKLNAWRFCSLTAGIRGHCSLSRAYISTAQEDVLCDDHNDVAPEWQ